MSTELLNKYTSHFQRNHDILLKYHQRQIPSLFHYEFIQHNYHSFISHLNMGKKTQLPFDPEINIALNELDFHVFLGLLTIYEVQINMSHFEFVIIFLFKN